MKKLFVVLVAAAFVFGATSCKKECACDTYLLGEIVHSTTYEVSGSKSCTTVETYDHITESGIKCGKK
jgi:hypothetical protein